MGNTHCNLKRKSKRQSHQKTSWGFSTGDSSADERSSKARVGTPGLTYLNKKLPENININLNISVNQNGHRHNMSPATDFHICGSEGTQSHGRSCGQDKQAQDTAMNSISVNPGIYIYLADRKESGDTCGRIRQAERSRIAAATHTLSASVTNASNSACSLNETNPSESKLHERHEFRKYSYAFCSSAPEQMDRRQTGSTKILGYSADAADKTLCCFEGFCDHSSVAMKDWVSWRTKANAQLAYLILLRDGRYVNIGTWERSRGAMGCNTSNTIIKHCKDLQQMSVSLPGKPFIMYGIPRAQVYKGSMANH